MGRQILRPKWRRKVRKKYGVGSEVDQHREKGGFSTHLHPFTPVRRRFQKCDKLEWAEKPAPLKERRHPVSRI